MKHRVKHNQLGRNHNQNKALKRGLVSAVFEYGRIETTLAKAKFVVPHVDKVMGFAKGGGVHGRRQIEKILGSDLLVEHIVSEVAPKTGSRTSGFTRIIKTGPRFSDATDMAILELVDYQPAQSLVKVEKEEDIKEEKKAVEKPKTEAIKPQKVQKAKPQTTQKIKAVGNK